MSRPLTASEIALVRSVFADAVTVGPVRILRGGFGRFAVTVGSRLFVPPELASSDYAAEPPVVRAFFIHEMTHVWQFQTRPLRTLASWARTAASGGYGAGLPGYRYTRPIARWDSLNLEQQASVVEHAYLSRQGSGGALPAGATAEDYVGRTPFFRS